MGSYGATAAKVGPVLQLGPRGRSFDGCGWRSIADRGMAIGSSRRFLSTEPGRGAEAPRLRGVIPLLPCFHNPLIFNLFYGQAEYSPIDD